MYELRRLTSCAAMRCLSPFSSPFSTLMIIGAVITLQTLVATSSVSLAKDGKPAELPPLTAVEGKPAHGKLVGIDENWKLTFEGGEKRTLPAANLVQWGRWPELPSGAIVVLPGGDVIALPPSYPPLKIDAQQLKFEADTFGELKLPLEHVCGLVLNPPTSRDARNALLQRIVTAQGDGDRLLLVNGDELTGMLAGFVERFKNGEKEPNRFVQFETSVGKIEVDVDKVACVIFNPSLAARPAKKELRAMLGFKDGSRLTAAHATLDAKQLSFQLSGGAKLQAEPAELVALQPLGGNVDYLSDINAGSYKHVPFLDLPWPYFTDRSVLGQPLRAGGATFRKGIGLHSTARLTYDLPRAGGSAAPIDFKRFQAEVAIDDATAGGGSVIFRVLVDRGNATWDEALVTPIVRGNDPPLPISVDLTGAKRLTLRVDFADRGDELDHADWLNARLVQ